MRSLINALVLVPFWAWPLATTVLFAVYLWRERRVDRVERIKQALLRDSP